jgi:hypothetical protein
MAGTVWRTAGEKTHLKIEQGATFRQVVTIANAWTVTAAALQVRAPKTSSGLLLDIDESAGITITNNGSSVDLELYVSAADTGALDWGSTLTGDYDLQVTLDTGDVHRILEGQATLSLEVTR